MMNYHNHNYGGGYRTTGNPNDTTFRGMGLPYQMSDDEMNHRSRPYRRRGSGGKAIITILVILALAAVGFGYFKMVLQFNGTYVLEEIKYQGITMSMDQYEKLGGLPVEGTIKINGKLAHMELSDAGGSFTGKCDVEVDGYDISFKKNGQGIEGTYDPDEKTITFRQDGVGFVFKKQ